MTETSDIATALVILDQAIYDMNTHDASSATTPTAHTPLIDPYNLAMPFQLYS